MGPDLITVTSGDTKCLWAWKCWLSSAGLVPRTKAYLWSFCLLTTDLHQEQQPTADWQPKWDTNHNKLCRSSVFPFLQGKKWTKLTWNYWNSTVINRIVPISLKLFRKWLGLFLPCDIFILKDWHLHLCQCFVPFWFFIEWRKSFTQKSVWDKKKKKGLPKPKQVSFFENRFYIVF